MHSQLKEKKKHTSTNFNTNYRREMKLFPINIKYCLLSVDVLFFFGGRLHGGLYLILI